MIVRCGCVCGLVNRNYEQRVSVCEADCETVYTEEVEEKQSLSMTLLVERQADGDMKKSLSIGG